MVTPPSVEPTPGTCEHAVHAGCAVSRASETPADARVPLGCALADPAGPSPPLLQPSPLLAVPCASGCSPAAFSFVLTALVQVHL